MKIKRIRRLHMKPGDIAVITYPGHLTLDQAVQLKAEWEKRFPDNTCVVFDNGGEVTGVLREREAR